ncbi:MAG: cell division protein ZapE [Steroidobacteraceae bacterium]
MPGDAQLQLQEQTLLHARQIDSLLVHYENELVRLGHQPDAVQRHAVQQLDNLRQRLIQALQPRSFWKNLLPRDNSTAPEPGLYFWGGVGRGKTWLMDMFYHSLPFKQKQRSHFHRFMQFIHEELKRHRDRADPLDVIAEQLAKKTRVLCFDELYVSDIADAMLLSNLFRSLFDRGVTLVATSNCAPDELYKDGLQRVRFLPAIKLIKKNSLVLNIDSGIDYRLRHLQHARTWFDDKPESQQEMLALFTHLADGIGTENGSLELNHRKLKVRHLSDDALWFDFKEVCDGPRGSADYIELARCYHSVFISNMPQLTATTDNQMRRFINLVDEFYDRSVKLFISAATAPEEIYKGTQLSFEFRRCLSRLTEMQSTDYLALPHKP